MSKRKIWQRIRSGIITNVLLLLLIITVHILSNDANQAARKTDSNLKFDIAATIVADSVDLDRTLYKKG